jgi:hypothetical protein
MYGIYGNADDADDALQGDGVGGAEFGRLLA